MFSKTLDNDKDGSLIEVSSGDEMDIEAPVQDITCVDRIPTETDDSLTG